MSAKHRGDQLRLKLDRKEKTDRQCGILLQGFLPVRSSLGLTWPHSEPVVPWQGGPFRSRAHLKGLCSGSKRGCQRAGQGLRAFPRIHIFSLAVMVPGFREPEWPSSIPIRTGGVWEQRGHPPLPIRTSWAQLWFFRIILLHQRSHSPRLEPWRSVDSREGARFVYWKDVPFSD